MDAEVAITYPISIQCKQVRGDLADVNEALRMNTFSSGDQRGNDLPRRLGYHMSEIGATWLLSTEPLKAWVPIKREMNRDQTTRRCSRDIDPI